ncbi:hypothetical protein F4811DRAFT_535417 [Daldinia bambusicola]|nr:hypothetical protein F4811DRAFT_535417 [Daldinia bambusicola]
MAQNPKTFLDLPVALRQRILLDAGIVCGTRVHFGRDPRRTTSSHHPIKGGFTYNILRTSKAIYEEAMSLILANNLVIIRETNLDSDLDFLRRLSPRSCSSLSELYIYLHVHLDILPRRDCIITQEQIAAWQVTARHILSNATPGKLKLYLICDLAEENSEWMSAALQPLLDFPGVLSECELRLHGDKDSRITEFAEEMARRIKGAPPNIRKGPFPYMKLPTEIRRNILEYTDLVAPGNQVQWNPNKGFHICTWHCCIHEKCVETRVCDKCCYLGCDPRTSLANNYTGDFCRRYHSCYSPRCKCWNTPKSLMLVNRTMYYDACDVFYRCNRIIIHPAIVSGYYVTHSTHLGNAFPAELSVSQFILRYKYPSILSSLRCLEIVFQPIDADEYPEEPHWLYAQWARAIYVLKAHANIAALTTIIHMGFKHSEDFKSTYFEEQMTLTGNNYDVVFKAHKRLLEPLQLLKEMRNFYVHLEWPWHWSCNAFEHPNKCLRRCRRIECPSCHADGIESWLETFVMGDEYNSYVTGKLKEWPSYWLTKEWKTFHFYNWSEAY